MKKRLISTVIILVMMVMMVGILAISQTVDAGTVYTTRPWADNGGPCLGNNGSNMAGVGLQVPAGTPYQLNSATFQLHEVTGGAEAIAYLYDDLGGAAGWNNQLAVLGAQNVGTTNTFGEYTFTPSSSIVLNPGEIYWFVVTSSNSSGCAIGFSSLYGSGSASGLFTLVGEHHFNSGSLSDRDGEFWMLEVDASPANVSDNYQKIGQVVVSAPGTALYEEAGGGVVRDANGEEIWVPNATADNPYQDTYDVISQMDVDGTTWVHIFVGNALDAVWIPVGGPVSPVQ